MQQIKFKYTIILAAITLIAITSCQKVINIKLDNAAPQIVIEGNLTDVLGPQFVTITKSVPFTSSNIFPPVTGAVVTITDSIGDVYNLAEGPAGIYATDPLKGLYGVTYKLTVQTGGKTYTASSTMPYPVPLDSLTDKKQILSNNDLYTITVNYQDPPKVTNQYLFVLYVNSQQAGTIFTNDDSFTNGRYVREDLFETGSDIHLKDTASVEMECIDEGIYKYWFSLSQQQNNGPGGGITPSNPPSNFNNNALGYFSAHTTETMSIIVH